MVIGALVGIVFIFFQIIGYGLGILLSKIIFPCCVLFAIAFWGMLLLLGVGLILLLLGLIFQPDGMIAVGWVMLCAVPFLLLFCIAMFFLLGIIDIVGKLCFFFIRGWDSIEIEHLFYPWTRLVVVAAT